MEQGRGRAGSAGSFSRAGPGRGRASEPGSGPGTAQRSRLSARTFPGLAHTGAGCSKSPGTGRGRAGPGLPQPCTFTPAAQKPSPGSAPRLPAPQSPGRAAASANERRGFHASEPAHPTDLMRPLAGWSGSGQRCSPGSSSKCVSDP